MLNDFYCKLLEATPARNPAALLGLHQSFVSSVLISAFLRLIRLSFSPTFPSALHYYLSSMSFDLSRRSCRIRKLPCRFRLYLRVRYRLFPLRRLVGLFRCRFDQCNVQACALAACTVSVISTNDAAYLPGLSLYVPRRSWKVAESNRLLIFRRFAPTIPAFTSHYVYPDFLLSLVILKNQRTSRRAG